MALQVISFEDDLSKLHDKLCFYSDSLHTSSNTKIRSEFIALEEQLNVLLIQMDIDEPICFEKKGSLSNSKGFVVQLIHSDKVCQYEQEMPPKGIKRGVIKVKNTDTYRIDLASGYHGAWLLIYFESTWLQKNVSKNINLDTFESALSPLHTHYFDKLLGLDTAPIFKKSLLMQLIASLMQSLSQPLANTTEKSMAIERVKNYLLENLHQPFPSLKFLADIACMSVSQLKTRFHDTQNISLEHFFVENRLETALFHLERGLSVKEIALLIGYANSSNFTNAFKRKYQVSPNKYRQNL